MRHFIGIVHKDEDSAYGISFPDVPGCFSASDTLEDLVKNASEALALWFEDEPMVEPRGLDEVVDDAAFKEAAEGASLILVPLITLTGRTVKANLTMDAGLLQAIDATAKARGMTRSAFIADAVRREVSA